MAESKNPEEEAKKLAEVLNSVTSAMAADEKDTPSSQSATSSSTDADRDEDTPNAAKKASGKKGAAKKSAAKSAPETKTESKAAASGNASESPKEDGKADNPDGLLSAPVPTGDKDAGAGERDMLKDKPPAADNGIKPAQPGAAAETSKPGGPGVERRDKNNQKEYPEGQERRGKGPSWQVKPVSSLNDDPLLGCLTILCSLLDRPLSADALTSGLPMDEGHLTPDLFVRAAERAGISARMQRRELSNVTKLALPCVVLLKGQRAAVVTRIRHGQTATVILPEMGSGSREIPYQELVEEYIGYALFARPEFVYDSRAEDTRVDDPKGWFWGTIFNSWRLYAEVIVAALVINSFAIASPLFVMNVYDRVVPNFAEETLWVLAIGVGFVFVFDFILKLLRGYLVDVAGKTADTRIAARLFQQVLGMKMANRPQSAGALANSMREFESLRDFFTSSTLTALIDLPFIFLFLAIVYVIGNALIVAVPLTVVVLVVIVGLIMQVPMQRIVKETQRESQQKHAILVEAITGIETIKLTAAESKMQRAWEVFVNKTARSSMLSTRWAQAAMNFSGTAMQFVTIGVVVVGVYQIQEGEMTVGALVACTILSGRALAPLSQIAGIATRFHQAKQALHALNDMMEIPVERPKGRSFVTRPNFAGHIEFKNVSFQYPDAQTAALTDVNFTIEAGEKVGFIGRIGSGKSTVERLMMGLHDPSDGSVMIDGTDTRQVDPADLRRNVGVVPQDSYLFFGSVKENIALGTPYADDAAILRASRVAGVDEFASKHPMGLDMPVGERGANLSGGQRQAVAVARALLADPPILIFDEPTSSMDNTSESRFKARLGTILTGKTLIMVTHRSSLLTLVDRLIVMDGGRVVADGPKDAVLEALSSGRIQTARV